MKRALALACALLVVPLPAWACGARTDCEVPGGAYRIVLPEGERGPVPGLIFLHGWKATASGVVKNRRLLERARELGVAVIVPQGEGQTWSYPGSPSDHRDEFAFFDALRRDLIRKHPLDPERLFVSGFSMGGSMAWFLACERGSDYAGFIPFAGAFWNPIPQDCPDPARILLHTHGTGDTVVPIGGRAIGSAFRQSDVRKSLQALIAATDVEMQASDCPARNTCVRWSGSGYRYEFRAHPGGHVWKPDWLADALAELL